MTYRRTWFGYVLWVIYAGLCVTMLAFIGFTLWKEYIPFPMAQAGAFFIFPLLLGVYALLRTGFMRLYFLLLNYIFWKAWKLNILRERW